MKKLYGTIMINKQIMDKQNGIQESINYYKVKDTFNDALDYLTEFLTN